ncbi:MAG: HupE/UreJ family protein [Kofleriaceae bacterium]
MSVDAAAHQTSMKELELEVSPGLIKAELVARADDVASAIGRDRDAGSAALLLGDLALAPTVTSWVRFEAGGQACTPSGRSIASARREGRWLAVSWTLRCPVPTRELRLGFETFFLLDASHTLVLRVAGPGTRFDTVVTAEDASLLVRLGAPTRRWRAWLGLGVAHIAGGADHLCFVLALLLGAVISRRAPGPASARAASPRLAIEWRMRSAREAATAATWLITSFSIAHSLSLAAATLGWLSLPSRLVETTISLSIGYAAIETFVRPDRRGRGLWALGFGLVHGLGFAGSLQDFLPAENVGIPLMAFNLGVEIGQLAIIAVTLPALLLVGNRLGARRYRRVLLPAVSLAMILLSAVWSVERALAG